MSDSQNQEAQFHHILDGLMDGVIVVDQKGGVCYRNPAAEPLLRLLPPTLFEKDTIWKAKVGKTLELFRARPEGGSSVVEMRVAATRWEDQPAYLAVLRDISEEKERQRKLQEELDQSQARAAQLEAMRFVADQLNQAVMLDETIQSGLQMIQALTGATAVWAILAEEGKPPQLVLIENRPGAAPLVQRDTLNLPQDCTCLTRYLAGEMTVPLFIENCEWMGELFKEARPPHRHVSFPLATDVRPLGVLNVACAEGEEMSDATRDLVVGLSRQLAVAIQRARRYSASLQMLRQSEAISEVTRTIGSTLDLPTMLQNVLQLAIELTAAEAGSLALLSEDEEYLNFPFVCGLPPDVALQPLMRGKNLFWDAILSKKPLLINDFSSSGEGLLGSLIPDLRGLLMAPILTAERCYGVIALYNLGSEGRFSDFDLSLVESLGRQAGMAVQNAQLYFEVQQLTTTDTLTGLNTTPSFNNLAVKEVERAWRYGRPLSIILVDIDGMKGINASAGMPAGDLALQAVARACLHSLRRVDILGRYENDAIVLLLPETDIFRAHDVAERLRLQVASTPIETDAGPVTVTVSMGVAGIAGRQEVDLSTLIERAEAALFDARLKGPSSVAVWHEEG